MLFSSVNFETSTIDFFFSKFFVYYFLKVHLHHFYGKIMVAEEVVENCYQFNHISLGKKAIFKVSNKTL